MKVEILEDELYMSAVSIVAYTILSLLTLKVYLKSKGKTLLFYFLAWFSMSFYLIVEMLGFVFLNPFIWKMSYVILSVSFLFWMLFIDHAFSDGISWKRFSIGAVYCSVFVFWALMPGNSVEITTSVPDGQLLYTYAVPAELLYIVLFDLYTVLYGSTFVYWNISTLKVIPDQKRKEAKIMLVAGVSMLVTSALFFVMDIGLIPVFKEEISMVSYILLLVGSVLSTAIIYRFPRITHLLPYTVYRLVITNKTGVPYYEHKWSPKEIELTLLSGWFAAVSTMVKSVTDEIEMGIVREMVFDKVVFLLEARYSPVTIGVVTSKSSKDLRNSIAEFSSDFVNFYYDTLYNKDGFPKEIKQNTTAIFLDADVERLIQKHFPNVPNYIAADGTGVA